MTEERSRPRRFFGHPVTHLFAALLVLGLTQTFIVKMFMVPSESMEQTLEIGDRLLVNRLAYALPGNDGVPESGDVVVFQTDDELWPRAADPDAGTAIGALKHGAKWVFGDLIGIGPTTSDLLVKRVIGTPGQSVRCCSPSGELLVDGEPLAEPYVFEDVPFEPGSLDCDSTPRSARCFPEATVPEGMLLVLGDHRSASNDGVAQCRGADEQSSETCVRWVRAEDVWGEVAAVILPVSRWGTIR